MEPFEKLPEVLLPWYAENKRDLPWRKDRKPYHIWLSEIMLQQTRVEAVKGYYSRFLAALPEIEDLAACDDELLQKLWEGLGYYSRVRNLKKAAGIILEKYAGVFPSSYEEILALPGIGPYTAGAICSIAYNLPVPAVDGNVLRVASRLTADPTPVDRPDYQKKIREALAEIYPAEAGAFTQALIELGATVCGPNRKPECGVCPCREFCMGALAGNAESFPVKTPKKPKRTEEKTVFLFSCEGQLALEKRPASGLLAGLWQFPNVPGRLTAEQALVRAESMGVHPSQILKIVNRTHIFTHIRWEMEGVYLEVKAPEGPFVWKTEQQLEEEAALPTAFRQFRETQTEKL